MTENCTLSAPFPIIINNVACGQHWLVPKEAQEDWKPYQKAQERKKNRPYLLCRIRIENIKFFGEVLTL